MPIIAIGMGDYDLEFIVKLGHSHIQSQRMFSCQSLPLLLFKPLIFNFKFSRFEWIYILTYSNVGKLKRQLSSSIKLKEKQNNSDIFFNSKKA